MICDGNICPEKYEDEKIYEQSIYDIDQDEFIKNLKHEKCKIIQLVRRQIHKFYDTEFELSSISNEWQKKYTQEPEYISYKDIRQTTPKTFVPKSTRISTGQAWCLCALKRIRRKICMVVLIAGIIALMASIYGIYFHAYLCNNGKSCVTSLRYTHVKHALF